MNYVQPARYNGADLEKNTFSDELKPVVEYLKSFKGVVGKNYREQWELYLTKDSPKKNLILSGGVGLGKTWLMHAFLHYFTETYGKKALCWKDDKNQTHYKELEIPVEYMKIKNIIDGIRNDWNSKNGDYTIRHMSNIPLLIIDEVGVNYGTDSERIELYELFNHRWENMLPTIVISNLTPEQQAGILGQRILDRLCDGALIVHLEGKSRREHEKNWNAK